MSTSSVSIRLLNSADQEVLADVAPDVFDGPIQSDLVAEFLSDDRHHLAFALDAGRVVGRVVGIGSAVHSVPR